MTAPDREARTLASLDRCIAELRARLGERGYREAAEDHAADPAYVDHDFWGGDDQESDPTGRMADEEAARVENNWGRQAYR